MQKKKKKLLLSAVAITAAAAALPATAAPADFYGVLSVGQSTLDNNPGSINTFNTSRGFTTSSTTTDDGNAYRRGSRCCVPNTGWRAERLTG